MSYETAPWEKFEQIKTQNKLQEKLVRQFIAPKKYFYQYVQGTMPEFSSWCDKKHFSLSLIDEFFRGIGMYLNLSNPFLGLLGFIAIGINSPWQMLNISIALITISITARLLNSGQSQIRSGLYGYNAVFIGLVLSYISQSYWTIFIVILLSMGGHILFLSMGQVLVNKYQISVQIYPSLALSILWILVANASSNFDTVQFGIKINNTQYSSQMWGDSMINGLSAFTLSENYISGIILVLGWFICSPLLGLLSLMGVFCGTLWSLAIGLPPDVIASGLNALNCITPLMNITSMYFVPNIFTLFLAILASFFSVLINVSMASYFSSIKGLNIATFTLASLIVNSIFQLSPWSTKYIIPITLGNITTPEDHHRRNKLKDSILTKFGEIKQIINNSQFSTKLGQIEKNLLPILLLTYTKENQYMKLKNLLQLGADPNLSDYDSRTCLHIACRNGYIDIIQLLIKYKASTVKLDRYNHNCFYEAFMHKKVYIFDQFPNAKIIAPPRELAWIFCNLVYHQEEASIDLLIKLKVPINYYDYDKRTPLHIAVANNYYNLVIKLLNHNANPTLKDKFGNTPFDLAKNNPKLNQVFSNYSEKDSLNLEIDNMIEIKYKNEVNHQNLEIIQLLCNSIILWKENELFQPYVICALASLGDLNNLRKLHKMGIDLYQADYDGRTALHLACANNQLLVLNYLINHANEMDISAQDNWGHTPLFDACINSHNDIVEKLVFHNAKLNLSNQQSIQILGWAIVSNEINMLKLLIKSNINLDCYDYDQRTARKIASEYNIKLRE